MERKLTKYLILISLILFTSQTFSQSQIKLLERAYKENSDSLMQIFLDQWKKDFPVYPISIYNYTDDTTKSVLEIYQFFYLTPSLEDSIAKSEIANVTSYKKSSDFRSFSKFIQDDVHILITENLWFFRWYEDPYWSDYEPDNNRRDTLKIPEIARLQIGTILSNHYVKNFRPMVNDKMIYVNSSYLGVINYFLHGNYLEKSYVDFEKIKLKRNYDEFEKRLEFISRYFPIKNAGPLIINGDKTEFGGIDFLTYPSINTITFDHSLLFARVDIWDDCNQIIYFMKKINGKWQIKNKNEICWCG